MMSNVLLLYYKGPLIKEKKKYIYICIVTLLQRAFNQREKIYIYIYIQLNHLKSSWTPINKLNGSLGLDCCNGCIHILWNHITTVQQTTGHIFTMTWVTFHHLIGWLKAGIGDFSNTQLFVISFLC